jgi:signal transduction histidine kinase
MTSAATATKSAIVLGVAASDCEYQELMSEMFHDLSQPLSTVTCLVEVNLMLPRSLKQMRHDLKIALQQTRTIVRLFRNLRELWEAGHVQQEQQPLSLTFCLKEAITHLLPMSETGVKISPIFNSDCLVRFQASRLRQALLHLLEFALGASAVSGEVKVTAGEEDGQVRVRVAISAVGSELLAAASAAESGKWRQHDLQRRVRLAIARRIFETADGSLRLEDSRSGEGLFLEVRLPMVRSPK